MVAKLADKMVIYRVDRRDLTNDELLEIIGVMLENWGSGVAIQSSLDAIADDINDKTYLKLQNFLTCFTALLELLED